VAEVEVIDLGLDAIIRETRRYVNSYVKVGFPTGGTASDEGSESFDEVVQIAAVHEFGAPSVNIPERSFLRSAFDEDKRRIDSLLADGYLDTLAGKSNARQALGKIGEWFAARVKRKITAIKSPPLAPRTAAAKARKGKGSGVPNPLIETGQMRASVQTKVVING
jgi:hypothetical protein